MTKESTPSRRKRSTGSDKRSVRRTKSMDVSVEGIVIFTRALVDSDRSIEFIETCRARGLRIRVSYEIIDLARKLLGESDTAEVAAAPQGVTSFVRAARQIASQDDDRCRS